jgi:proline racemase/trans-L-3-hydroxyproline dehydratase
VTEPVTEVKLDIPAGRYLSVDVKNGEQFPHAKKSGVRLRRVLDLYLPSIGKTVKFDICFGGSFLAILKDVFSV